MTLNITRMPEEAIILIEVSRPIAYPDDPAGATEAALQFLDEVGGTICRITDFSDLTTTFGDLVAGMAADTSFSNPNIHNVVITTNALVKMGSESFKQEQYGGVDVTIVANQDEAMAAARALFQPS